MLRSLVALAACVAVSACDGATRRSDEAQPTVTVGSSIPAPSSPPTAVEPVGVDAEMVRNELLQMARVDQEERSEFGDPAAGPWNDQARTARLIEIVDQFGWPTPELVGSDGASAAFLIAQHSDANPAFQQRALLLLTAVEPSYPGQGEHVALLTDRVATNMDEPQVYGSQIGCADGEPIPDPDLAEPDRVDELRDEAGLEPLDVYLARFAAHCSELARLPQRAGCTPLAGAEDLFEPGAVVLVGEVHGTVESPAFVGALVCIAVSYGYDVVVGLEIPDDEATAIQQFLASDGGADARQALLAGPFWSSGFEDGRQSVAMLELIEGVREHIAGGASVEVVLLDALGVNDRDVAMASRLLGAVGTRTDGMTITLTGNVHSRAGRGGSFDPEYEPMGFLVDRALGHGRVRSLDVSYSGGTAWVCSDDGSCGERSFESTGPGDVTWSSAAPSVQLLAERNSDGFDGMYFVGEISAAPPAAEASG